MTPNFMCGKKKIPATTIVVCFSRSLWSLKWSGNEKLFSVLSAFFSLRWQMIADLKDIESGVFVFIRHLTPKLQQKIIYSYMPRTSCAWAVKKWFLRKRKINIARDYFALYLFICKRQIHNSKNTKIQDEAPRCKKRVKNNIFIFWCCFEPSVIAFLGSSFIFAIESLLFFWIRKCKRHWFFQKAQIWNFTLSKFLILIFDFGSNLWFKQ